MFVLFIPVEGKCTRLELMVGYKGNISRRTHTHRHRHTQSDTHVQRESGEFKGKNKSLVEIKYNCLGEYGTMSCGT